MIEVTKLIKKKLKKNRRKVKEYDNILSAGYHPLNYKVEGIRLYHLGAVKELQKLLQEVEVIK